MFIAVETDRIRVQRAIQYRRHGLQPVEIEVDFAADLDLPITIGTLESTQIGVWFNPIENTVEQGMISIHSNDPFQDPATANVIGRGLVGDYPIGTELWSYEIDVSWDNSPKAMAPISDISGDGRGDVIVCSEDYIVRCFNGNASGTGDVLWEHEIYSGPVYSSKGLDVVADIDGDGFEIGRASCRERV